MPQPYFSICIPQYNRTLCLIEACGMLERQTFRDFEVCISDDQSKDGRNGLLRAYLERADFRSVYRWQERNLRYDANLRAAIGLASGKYCLLMGNDDALAGESVLERLHGLLEAHPRTGVAITNYLDLLDGRMYERMPATRCIKGNPGAAAHCFRNFSFVSGVVLLRERAQDLATGRWDGSEMYQTYIGCRIIAEGFSLLEIADTTVHQNVRVAGDEVDSYAAKPKLDPCPVVERRIPLVQLAALVSDAIRPHAGRGAAALTVRIFVQLLLFTYPFWVLEYRRVQSWRYAAGICIGMRPRNLLQGVVLPLTHSLLIRSVYLSVTCAALILPQTLFLKSQKRLHSFAKSFWRNPQSA